MDTATFYMDTAAFNRAASSASGHRFYYLKGAAARLEIGLVQYAMDKAISRVKAHRCAK